MDPAEWRLEVERVAPRLKITVASSARDWRSHLDDAHKHSADINTIWPDAQAALGAVQAEVIVSTLGLLLGTEAPVMTLHGIDFLLC